MPDPSPFSGLPDPIRSYAEMAVRLAVSSTEVVEQEWIAGRVDPHVHYAGILHAGVLRSVLSGGRDLEGAAIAAGAAVGFVWARRAILLCDRVSSLEEEVARLRAEVAGSASLADPPSVDLSGMPRGARSS